MRYKTYEEHGVFNVASITQISNDDITIISQSEFIHTGLRVMYSHYELSLIIIKNHELLCEMSISRPNLYNEEFVYAYIWGLFIKDILLCGKDKIGKMIANYTGFIKIGEFTESYLANTLTYDLIYRDTRGIRELIESEMASYLVSLYKEIKPDIINIHERSIYVDYDIAFGLHDFIKSNVKVNKPDGDLVAIIPTTHLKFKKHTYGKSYTSKARGNTIRYIYPDECGLTYC